MSELENSLWSFRTNKSLGEDSLPIEWYRQCGYLIKYDFLNITSDIQDSHTLTDSQYKGGTTVIYKSFQSLLQNTIGNNDSLYTVNKQTYIHSLYINTKIYQQINVLHYKYNYISTNQLHVYTTRKLEVHTGCVLTYVSK